MKKNPANLVQIGGIWHWRLSIPRIYQSIIGLREIKRSLKTGYLRDARPKAAYLTGHAKLFMKKMTMKDNNKHYKDLLLNQLQQWILEIEINLLKQKPEYFENQENIISEINEQIHLASKKIKCNDTKNIEHIADRLITNNKLDIKKNSHEYRELSYRLLHMSKAAICTHKYKIVKTDFLWRPKTLREHKDTDNINNRNHNNHQNLSKLVSDYLNYRKSKGELTHEKTYNGAVTIYDGIIKIIGDVKTNTIDAKIMDLFVERARKLKRSWNHTSNKNKPLEELYAQDNEQPLSPTTINNWISAYLSPLIKYGIRHKATTGISDISTSEITIKISDNGAIERKPLTNECLEQLFNCDYYTNDTFKHAWQFWCPILSYYTGARLEELCQLYKSDIIIKDKIAYISINKDHPDKKLKNKNAKRNIPLHEDIIDLGFLNYINKINNGARIFFDLEKKHGNYGHDVSKWFSNFSIEIGIRKNKNNTLVFHSLRHTFISLATMNDINETLRRKYTGHSDQNTDSSYIHIMISKLKTDVIDLIPFHIRPLHLKTSKWCK